MFIVERGTRKVLYAEPFTPEQRQRAWEYLIRKKAPKLIREELERLKKEAMEKATEQIEEKQNENKNNK